MGLTVINVMNRTTTTTVNGYIIYGGRGGREGASLSSSGGWEDHGGGGRGRNYDNGGINVKIKRVFRGGTRVGEGGGTMTAPPPSDNWSTLSYSTMVGNGSALGGWWP